MSLVLWLPGLFVFGLAAMGCCDAFIDVCERI